MGLSRQYGAKNCCLFFLSSPQSTGWGQRSLTQLPSATTAEVNLTGICKNWQCWNDADSTTTSWAILGQFAVLLPIFSWFVNKKEF